MSRGWLTLRSSGERLVVLRRKLLSGLNSQPSRVVVVAVMASLVFSAVAIAAAGDLDPTFSVDGKQRTNFGAERTAAAAAVLQADGKIVAVGAADGNFLVARYNPDGSLDPSFSGDGRLQTSFTGFDSAADVALQGNKIVVVGFTSDNTATARFALARYNPDGSLDPNFSGDGKQTTAFGGNESQGRAEGVALHSGRIVAVGIAHEAGSPSDFALARYNLNGSLDTSFSDDGKQTTDLVEVGLDDAANGVAIQADGKIVAVGVHFVPHDRHDFALARFNPDGSLDTSFSGDGLQTTNFGGGGSDWANGVAIQADGKIVAVGFARGFFAAGRDFGLARYNPDGSLDTSFSDDGLQTTDFLFDAGDDANDVAIQADGEIVAAGVARGGATGNDFGLARYNPDGTLDTSFSADGRKRTNFGGSSGSLPSDGANDVALQGDGRIVAVGVGDDEFALARYLGD